MKVTFLFGMSALILAAGFASLARGESKPKDFQIELSASPDSVNPDFSMKFDGRNIKFGNKGVTNDRQAVLEQLDSLLNGNANSRIQITVDRRLEFEHVKKLMMELEKRKKDGKFTSVSLRTRG